MKIVNGETYIVRFSGENKRVQVLRIYEENGQVQITWKDEGIPFTDTAKDFRQRVEQAAIVEVTELEEVEI